MNDLALKEDIKSMIYEVRGKQVMLDSDLARLYECKNGTKSINLAVTRNIERFPEEFYFQLTDEEYNSLRFQIETSNITNYSRFQIETLKSNSGGRRYNPYVFTEQGVAMLSSVLHTEKAVSVSINIMNAFVSMRKYISSNLIDQKNINNLVLEDHSHILKMDDDIKLLQECFDKFEEKEILLDKTYDAYSILLDIFKSTKKELIIIDRYTDKSLLDIIKELRCKVILITSNKTKLDIKKYNESYNNLKVIYNDAYHDRYFIIDRDKIYHSGNSINHIGYRKSNINLLEDEKVKDLILKDIEKIIK